MFCGVPDRTEPSAEGPGGGELQDAAIAQQSFPGIWAGLASVQLVLLAGSFPKTHWLVISTFAVVVTGACLGRLFLVLRKDAMYPRHSRRWRFTFVLSCSCSPAPGDC